MDARACRHGLHIYRSDAHLAGCVARFAAAGLKRGEPVILAPSRAHRADVIRELKAAGVAVEALEIAGLLLIADADELSRKCVQAARPDVDGAWDGFMSPLAELRARGFSGVSVWGETADLLLKAGRPELFRDLESRWHEEVKDGGINLLCSYRADLLDENPYTGELEAVCGRHSHVASIETLPELEGAVDGAFVEVLGHRDTGMAWSLASADDALPKALPPAAHRLRWVVANMPATYKKVFAAARARAAAPSA